MAINTLYNHVWNSHKVCSLSSGQDQLFIGLHLIHEVTSPQAFSQLAERQSPVAFPHRTFATIDHIIPTTNQSHRPFIDQQAELMSATLEYNVKEHRIPFFDTDSGHQGIVHVIGPELGLTQPGMTIACGDSHTSTHGAFGSLGFGIGTTEVGFVLETQTLALSPLNVRHIIFNGSLSKGLSPKDVILKIIQQLGVEGGIGYAYEYSGDVFDAMSMDGRMTVCNMSIEGGARIGYMNPDHTTFDYLKKRRYAPPPEQWDAAVSYWNSIRSSPDATYDDVVSFHTNDLSPMVTWGITPAQSIGVCDHLPDPNHYSGYHKQLIIDAFSHMQLTPNTPLQHTPIDVVFIGSCTNSRLSDLREAAAILKGHQLAQHVTALVVPGSQQIKQLAEAEGLHDIFLSAGAEWRDAGCSMCLAMNPDKLLGSQLCASTSNRNFIGRQGSPHGRTLLMSPAMAAAAAITGVVTDVRELLS